MKRYSDDGEDIARWFRQNSTHEQSAYNLAADEIERLRAKVASLQTTPSAHLVANQDAEIERLRAELIRIDHDREVAIEAHMDECRKLDEARADLEACKAERNNLQAVVNDLQERLRAVVLATKGAR